MILQKENKIEMQHHAPQTNKNTQKICKKMDVKFRYSFQNSPHAVCGLWLTWANVMKNNDQVALVSFTQFSSVQEMVPGCVPGRHCLWWPVSLSSQPGVSTNYSRAPRTCRFALLFTSHCYRITEVSHICRPCLDFKWFSHPSLLCPTTLRCV